MKAVDRPNYATNQPPTAATLAYRKFTEELAREGCFERTWLWDAFYVSSIIILAALGSFLSSQYPILASILIGLAMQQAGWIGHDYVHGRGRVSFIFGRLVGGLFNGFSPTWWSNKHNTHHVHTNQMVKNKPRRKEILREELHLSFLLLFSKEERKKKHSLPLFSFSHLCVKIRFIFNFLFFFSLFPPNRELTKILPTTLFSICGFQPKTKSFLFAPTSTSTTISFMHSSITRGGFSPSNGHSLGDIGERLLL
jgi:fatty acid desaturase